MAFDVGFFGVTMARKVTIGREVFFSGFEEGKTL